MKHSNNNEDLVIRVTPGKFLVTLLVVLFLIIPGVLMIILPAHPTNGFTRWNDTYEAIVGGFLILLGGPGLFVLLYTVTRPLLSLRQDGMTDHRRKLFIPFSDIDTMTITSKSRKFLPVQWIHLTTVNSQKYAALEKWSKQSGLTQDDVTLNLDLASAKDFQLARDYIRRHIKGVEDDGIRTLN